ncbi:hypothetical protein P154DRAFT_532017 [Amniculicola lignicola CBS 123094]|uniref:Zn(2)-C6 fungal-type domain-containing protein n=1 Tax=Amniculicola lignicola CBS 123094 TaxID=1392246 RepID=A0A6A5WQ22_9PLEO|nr:hypothetical protein P154DRAFT_532017 [Amniculicola lignicola CBS 123094]
MSDPTHTAPPQRTCGHCKTSKKKCDKLLPACSRCLRLSIDCLYPDVEKPDTSEVSQEVQNAKFDEVFHRLEKLEAHILTCNSTTQEEGPSSAQLSSNGGSTLLSDAPQSDDWKVNPGLLKPKALAFLLASSVSRALHENHTTARAIFEKYLAHTHHWLPVISKDSMTKAQRNFELILPDQDGSLFLLAAHLVVSPLSSHPGGKSDPDSDWYRTAKYHFGQCVAMSDPFIGIAQAGIMLALFEHTQCLNDRAHVTLGVASRILLALEIEETVSAVINRESGDVTSEEEEAVLTWWSLILMEKYINMPPLEIPKTSIIHQESLQLEFWDTLPMLPPVLQTFKSIESDNLRDVLRELESARLLGRVQMFIRKNRHADITRLSGDVEGLLHETDNLVARHIADQLHVGWSAGVAVALR